MFQIKSFEEEKEESLLFRKKEQEGEEREAWVLLPLLFFSFPTRRILPHP